MLRYEEPKEEDKRTPLEKRNDVFVVRVELALKIGIAVAVISAILAGFILNYQKPELWNFSKLIDFHLPFSDWSDPPRQEEPKNFTEFFGRGVIGFIFTLNAVFLGNLQTVTGITRTLAVVMITVAVGLSHRYNLAQQLKIDDRKAQLSDFEKTIRWSWKDRRIDLKGCFSALCFILATLLGSYVMVSILLFFLALAFTNMALNAPSALFVMGLICGVFAGVASFWSTAMDTRELTLLGMTTLVIGLLLSFSLNRTLDKENLYWWQIAVSAAGRFRPASPIFTAAFTSVFLAMVSVWFDLDTILPKFVETVKAGAPRDNKDGKIVRGFDALIRLIIWPVKLLWKLFPAAFTRPIASFVNSNLLAILGFLYGLTAILLLLVGLVPMNANELEFAHDRSAQLAGVLIVVLSLVIPKNPYFQPAYRQFSIIYVVAIIGFGGLYAVNWFAFSGFEILALAFIIIWIFATIDGLLYYMNNNWEKLNAPGLTELRKEPLDEQTAA